MHNFKIAHANLKDPNISSLRMNHFKIAHISTWLATAVMSSVFCQGKGICVQIITVFLRLQDGVFSFQNNPKVLDPSCKTDLELWHCLVRVELVL